MPDPLIDTGTPTTQAPAAAPSQPQPASTAPTGGASTAAPAGQPAGATGSPPTGQGFKDQLTAAMGGGGAPAGGQQPTNMLGQPTGQPAAAAPAQQQATFETVLAQHPHLAQQFNALMQYAIAGQQAAYQQQRQPAQPQPAGPAAPQANAFGIPQFDKAKLKYITQGADGQLHVSPYAPPGTLYEYEQYEAARRSALERLLDEPEKLLGSLFEKMLSERGPQIADSRIQDVQTRGYVEQYTSQNTWLWQTDQQGRRVLDWRGQPQLSDAGKYFRQVVEQLERAGVRDVRQQVQMAEQQVAGALAMARLNAGQQAQQQSDAGKQGLLNSAPQYSPPPPAPQGQANPADNFVQPGVHRGQAFRNALEQSFAAAGLNGVLN